MLSGRADAESLPCSWWDTEGNGGGKKQAGSERGGGATGTRCDGLEHRSVGSIPLCVASARSISRGSADTIEQRDVQFVLRRGKDGSDCYRCTVYIVSENGSG
jgi:hypothetical protein